MRTCAGSGPDRRWIGWWWSTSPPPKRGPTPPLPHWPGWPRSRQGWTDDDAAITPGLLYAYAAIREGCPYVNFTLSLGADVPARLACRGAVEVLRGPAGRLATTGVG